MFAFGTMLLFSVTGLTLNHPEWFGAGKSVTVDLAGEIDRSLLGDPDADPLASGRTFESGKLLAQFAYAVKPRLLLLPVRTQFAKPSFGIV